MEDRLVTLAIHTHGKALVLKQCLEEKGLAVSIEELPSGVDSIRINESLIPRAWAIIEEFRLFSYHDKRTYQMDDGRKRILVAVDFSSYSMKACQIAFSVAKELNAKVKILHVYNNIYFPSHLPFADTLKDEGESGMLDKSREQMLGLCIEIDKKINTGTFPSVNYSFSLREGQVEDEIESFIEEYKPSLLILGTKGAGNKKNNLLGEVTADVIEMTNIPVLAVPDNSPFESVKEIRHIAFFTNLHQRDLLSFDYLVNFLLPHEGLKITLVHIESVNKKKESRWTGADLIGLKELFNKKYPMVNVQYKLINAIDMTPVIKDFIEEEKIHIVAVNTRRRNVWERIFIPSASRKILATLDVAILALRGEDFKGNSEF